MLIWPMYSRWGVVEPRISEQLDEAHDAVEGRAYFMAHVCQEGRFRPVGGLGFLLEHAGVGKGLPEPFLGELSFGDIDTLCDGGNEVGSVVGEDICRIPQGKADFAAFAPDRYLDHLPEFPAESFLYQFERLFAASVGKEDVKPTAEHFIGGISCHVLKGVIEPNDSKIPAPHDDRCVGMLDQLVEVVAGSPEILLGPLPFRNVGDDGDEARNFPSFVKEGSLVEITVLRSPEALFIVCRSYFRVPCETGASSSLSQHSSSFSME